jgi:hypothetical protein
MYACNSIFRLCYAQLYLHTWTPAHARAHTFCAHTHARAHRRRRRAQRPAPHRRPGRARPACGGAPPGRKGSAYRGQRGDRGGVPRADVRVERRRILERLRAEPRAVRADRNALARFGADAQSHTHTRARTDAARARVCAAGAHRRSVHRCSQPRMDVDTCMRCVYIHCVCACSIDGWPYEDSAPHSRACRALAHRQRPHAIARVRKNTHAYPFTCPDFASIDRHIYIYSYMTCVGYIYRRTYPRAHV